MKLMLTLTLALLLGACVPRGPVVGESRSTPGTGGTIAGNVLASDGQTPVTSRRVTAVDVVTGMRFDVSTASTGGYTLKVPAGTYRLELELRQGESLTREPESTEVNVGDVDAGRDFIVTLASR